MVPALFYSALVGSLATAMGSLVGRVIIALGIGAVTYTGIDTGIGALKAQVIDSINGLPLDAINLLGFLWVDKALTVIFSAIVISLSMRTLSAAGGSMKKMVMK